MSLILPIVFVSILVFMFLLYFAIPLVKGEKSIVEPDGEIDKISQANKNAIQHKTKLEQTEYLLKQEQRKSNKLIQELLIAENKIEDLLSEKRQRDYDHDRTIEREVDRIVRINRPSKTE